MESVKNGRTARIKELEAEVARLEAERIAIQNDSRALTCVFCGMVYPPGTPPSNHAALLAHVEECPKHPLQRFKQRAAAAETFLNVIRKNLPLLESTGLDLLTVKEVAASLCALEGKNLVRMVLEAPVSMVDLVPLIDAELEYRRFQRESQKG